MLLKLDQLYEYNWYEVFETMLVSVTDMLKNHPKEHIFEDFLRLTVKSTEFLSMI